jgi:hypothetical protein
MYKKLACVCGHEFLKHEPCADCLCNQYDPAGHNPELENVLCPECRLLRLEKLDDRTYICIACKYVMLESQVLRLVG